MKRLISIGLFLLLLSTFTTASAAQRFINSNDTGGNAPLGQNTVYLPLVRTPQIDFAINRIEVTQAVQNNSNSIPLVKDRTTIVRLYTAVQGQSGINSVVTLNANRNGASIGTLTLSPAPINQSPTPGNYSSTTNFTLPPAWLSGNVTLTAEIDPNNTIPEFNESNNTITQIVNFNVVPQLDLKLVPINYTHTPNGTFFPAPTSDTVSDRIIHLFPVSAVNVSLRSPANFSGNLGQLDSWVDAIQMIHQLKLSDGAPNSQVYYGVFPVSNPGGQSYPLAFGGYGYIGLRAGVGIEMNPPVAAHEVGHNFGLLHAPCGNPAGPDPNYPYPNGSIGLYGLDVFDEQVWSPTAPDNTKDYMSYCSPPWISDYHYKKLYNNQISMGFSPQAEAVDGLMVRINIDPDSNPIFEPIYEINTRPTPLPQTSQYQLQLLDSNANIIESYPVSAYSPAPEEDQNGNEITSERQSIGVVIPSPAQPIYTIRLLRQGVVIAQKTLARQLPSTYLTISPSSQPSYIEWTQTGRPTLIRVKSDNNPWTTLGLDHLDDNIWLNPNWLPNPSGDVQVEIIYGR